MTEIDDAWKSLNENGFALDYDEDSRPGALAKAIDYALAAKDDDIATRDERISELEAQVEHMRNFIDWVSTWVNQPVGAFSIAAIDGLFGMARDSISTLPSTEDRRG